MRAACEPSASRRLWIVIARMRLLLRAASSSGGGSGSPDAARTPAARQWGHFDSGLGCGLHSLGAVQSHSQRRAQCSASSLFASLSRFLASFLRFHTAFRSNRTGRRCAGRSLRSPPTLRVPPPEIFVSCRRVRRITSQCRLASSACVSTRSQRFSSSPGAVRPVVVGRTNRMGAAAAEVALDRPTKQKPCRQMRWASSGYYTCLPALLQAVIKNRKQQTARRARVKRVSMEVSEKTNKLGKQVCVAAWMLDRKQLGQ